MGGSFCLWAFPPKAQQSWLQGAGLFAIVLLQARAAASIPNAGLRIFISSKSIHYIKF